MAINYAAVWKNQLRLKELSYEDFVTEYHNISGAYYLAKMDGQLGAMIFRNEDARILSVNNIEIKNVPVLDEYRSVLLRNNIKSAIIMGEVVAVKAGKILPFNRTESIVKTSYKPQNAPLVHHYAFDVIMINDKKVRSFPTAIGLIERFFRGRQGRIHVPDWTKGGIKEFRKLWTNIQNRVGIEGILVRMPDGRAFKVKPHYTADLAVIGAGSTVMPAWKKGWISYLKTAWVDKDGIFLSSSNVGTGYTHAQRKFLFNEVQKTKVKDLGTEFLVPPERVIEVRYDRAHIKQMPTFQYVGGEYRQTSARSSITLVIPRFLRFRDDKSVNPIDCRPEQIPGYPER